MTDAHAPMHPASTDGARPGTVEEARAMTEATREELGRTVQALAARADVKERAQHKLNDLKDRVGTVTPDQGRQATVQVVSYMKERPEMAIGVAALLVGWLIGRRSTRS